MLRSRVGPAIAATALIGGGIYWQTRGGKQQPAGRALKEPRDQTDISGRLEAAAGTGGAAAKPSPPPGGGGDVEPRTQTRIYSHTPGTPSKKDPGKAREGAAEDLGPVSPMQAGKHVGEPEEGLRERTRQQ